MPVEIDGQIIRNVPEQVLENMNDIEQLKYDIDHIDLSNCAKLDGNNIFTGNNDFANLSVLGYEVATKAYVSAAIETVKRNAFIKVNIDIYPTLADFLLSDGEEGYIYLYPIDPSEAPTFVSGFYQYIWEDNDWLGVGTTKIDLSNYVDLTSDQTITGVKTFNKIQFPTSAISYIQANTDGRLVIRENDGIYLQTELVRPFNNNFTNLGNSSYKWKDLYLAGNISDGTNSVTVADISNGILNVINAADIVNNTLTQAQFDLITNGKPTLILGIYLGYKNLIIISYWNEYATTWRSMAISQGQMFSVLLNTTTMTLSTGSNDLVLNNIAKLNNKTLPNYPANTGTFVLKCVDGTLTWVQE